MGNSASLNASQQAVYHLDKFIGGSICNICVSTLFPEKHSVDEIKNAIATVFKRNDALRIRIKEENGKVVQYLTDFYPDEIEVLRFKSRDELDGFGEKWANEPIDLNGQLCEIKVFVLPDDTGAICRLHHIIGDAWTLALIGIQLSKTLRGEPFETYSFFDSLKSESEYRSSSRYERDKAYYEEQFLKSAQTLFLSDKRAHSFRAKRAVFMMDREKTEQLSKYAESNGTSLFNLLLTAFSVYIGRIKMNVERFCIGIPLLNRSGAVEKNTMGNFVNAVPFFVELNSNGTFSENLASINGASLKILRHQRYNYDELLEDLRSKFNFSGKLFDVMIDYQNAVAANCVETKLHFHGMQQENLMIHMIDHNSTGKIELLYDYLAEIFDENDIAKIHSTIIMLLDDAIKNPDKKICELEIAPEAELSILRGDKTIVSGSETIPSLFEDTVAKKGDEICIVTDDRNYTFAGFNDLVKSIDLEIRKITRGKKQTVAVVAERSVEMYASIYAILRGGNSYLPIDPTYPKERIEYMLENSGTKIVLVQDRFRDLFDGIKCLNVSEIIKNRNVTTEDLLVSALPEETAYVIYTSGSTGRPKGVKVSHRSLLNRILWMEKAYPLDENSVILQKTPFTFDVSLWEIFWWGIFGKKMAFMKSADHFLPEKIVDEINRKNVTTIHFVPSVLDLFVKYLEKYPKERERIATLKDVFVSGEVLSAALINRSYAMFSAEKVKIHNLYGPTECAVDVTFYDCRSQEADPVPIGRPIDNTDIFILDNNMRPVPKGVTGEICVGGANVGQGYVNNDALTNEVFMKNPFGEGMIYKTGDLGYINTENEIIFSGRKDDQIKLNGQRIELAEIENAMSEIDGITLAAVVARKNSEGSQILCAFYSGEKKENSDIRNELGKKLPRYMIPHMITHLDAMPLTSSGKIDRSSLTEAGNGNVVSDKLFVEARSDTELMVCDKFSEILHISSVGMDTDFFLSGGSSIDVLAFLSDERFRSISASEFITDPTPAGICAVLKSKKLSRYEYLQPLFVPEKCKRTLILVPYAGGNAESYSELSQELRRELPDTALYFVRFLHSAEECRAVFEEMKSLGNFGDLYFYAHCIGDAVALQIIDFIEEDRNEIGGLIVGANIPPKKPFKHNWWNIVPDLILKKILIKAGSKIGDLSVGQSRTLLRLFRKDCDFFINFFRSRTRKIASPLSVIINKNDIFTKDHKNAAENWRKYAENEVLVRYIESDTHYFQSKNADVLAKMIAESCHFSKNV